MEEKTIKIMQDKKGLFKRFNDRVKDKQDARAFLKDAVTKLNDFDISFHAEDQYLLTDRDNNVKYYRLIFNIITGHKINEVTIDNDEITKITIETYPSNLSTALGSYTVGGAMIGGIAGIAVGALIDGIKGQKKESIYLWFDFHTKHSHPYAFRFTAFEQHNVSMDEEEVERILREIGPIVSGLSSMFPDKMGVKYAPLENGCVSIDDGVLQEAIGIETTGGEFTALIGAKEPVPCESIQIFSTSEDYQEEITIAVYQGEERFVDGNRLIGRYSIAGMRKAPQGVPQIDAKFRVDVDGRFELTATDKFTNENLSINEIS